MANSIERGDISDNSKMTETIDVKIINEGIYNISNDAAPVTGLKDLENDLKLQIDDLYDKLNLEMKDLDNDLKMQIDNLHNKLDPEIKDLDNKLTAEIKSNFKVLSSYIQVNNMNRFKCSKLYRFFIKRYQVITINDEKWKFYNFKKIEDAENKYRDLIYDSSYDGCTIIIRDRYTNRTLC